MCNCVQIWVQTPCYNNVTVRAGVKKKKKNTLKEWVNLKVTEFSHRWIILKSQT